MSNICLNVKDNCKNVMESYGEICVGCNCCGRINNSKEAVAKANLIINIRHLKEVAEELFEEDFDTMAQTINILSSIKSYSKNIDKNLNLLSAESNKPFNSFSEFLKWDKADEEEQK